VRAVLDTNVFLQIILSGRSEGVAGAINGFWRKGAFQVVTSDALIVELEETLNEPSLSTRHGMSPEEISTYVQGVRALAVTTPGILPLEVPALEKRDPDDIAVLLAAVEGSTDCVVTQDRDLLDLGAFCAIPIIDPLDFLRMLRAEQPPPDAGGT